MQIMPDYAVRKQFVEQAAPMPPPAPYKHAVIQCFQAWSKARVLVETGTYEGDTTEALRPHFGMVYTIEASKPLYERAQERFANAKNVRLLFGDSGKTLPIVLGQIRQHAVFWLDAHWCGGQTHGAVLSSAIMPELEAIFAHPVRDHVILIDDARYFVGVAGYPTIDFLRRWVHERRPDLVFDVALDSIRIHP